MTTDDFLLDQAERTQRHQTRRRRDQRSRRKQLWLFGGLAMILLLVLGGPSLISHSSIGRSMVAQSLAEYGLAGDVSSVRIGWVTPLRVTGLHLRGKTGSEVTVDQLDMDMTVTDLLGSPQGQLGQIAVRGVHVVCSMDEGRCSLEEDLQVLWEPSAVERETNATLKLQDVTVSVTDAVSGESWQVSQSNVDVELTPPHTHATFSGVLTEPSGSGGSLQGSIEFANTTLVADDRSQWRLDLTSDSLPLSVVSLLRRRFPESAVSIPKRIRGDATGSVRVNGGTDGAVEASIRDLRIRNLTATDEGSRAWNNGLATLDGDLMLVGNRVIGKQLQASTDFASATIDGAFSRTFSLVGANDNPLRWLEAIDGTATAQIDLAAFNQSLPGILPLRDEAQIISGKAVAQVVSSPHQGTRQSQLHIRSDALRAQARGREVVIAPIELTATVSSARGQIRADQFEWKSTFGSAIGRGDLRAGNADVDIDFGRLTAMLRPIIQISETTLAGSAQGNIRWNASPDNVWSLSGDGSATHLLITLPGGRSLQRPAMQGHIEAIGRWGGQSLEELSRASVSLVSNGLDLKAELVEAVRHPSLTSPLPLQMQGNGRIETLLETLGPWLPPELHGAAGSFRMTAQTEASSAITRLTSASLELTEPRIAYGDRHFSQPSVNVRFEGDFLWPSGDLQTRSFTVAGDAFSMAAQGKVIPRVIGQETIQDIDMQVKWRAKLERIQGSVHKRVATQTRTSVQQAGYRPGANVKTDDWLVMGDCEGELTFATRDRLTDVHAMMTGVNLAIIQPPRVSAEFQTVGPMPRRGRSSRPANNASRVVWAEPNLEINGKLSYDRTTDGWMADAVQVAGDWFATTLTGSVVWNEANHHVNLHGPARLKMNEVAERLSSLAGVDLQAVGVQETPLEIRVSRHPDHSIALNVLGNVGWESGVAAGVNFGRASIPVRLTETSVTVAPSRIPVEKGIVNLAGQVHYRPGPLWMRLDRGVLAESVQLTPEMTNRWLKYLAPLAADTARISGTVGAEIDESVVVFDDPAQSRVTGRLHVGGAQMTASPMADQILGGIKQLQAISQPAPNPPFAAGQTWITMPVQTVDFSLDRGIVRHERLFLEVDRARIVTSGQVSLDGRLNLIAQVPLDRSWLGSDLQGLAGQSITLPIDGTLSRPSLDSSGVAQVVQQFGVQAVQSAAENIFQKQLNRVLDKTFNR